MTKIVIAIIILGFVSIGIAYHYWTTHQITTGQTPTGVNGQYGPSLNTNTNTTPTPGMVSPAEIDGKG